MSPLKKEHKHTFSEFMVIIPKESFHIRLLSIFLVASLQKGIKICSLLFSFLLLIHTAQFTRLLRSKRIGVLYPCYTPALTLFSVAAFNAALVSFLVPHTMRLFFVLRRLIDDISISALLRITSASCRHSHARAISLLCITSSS